MGRFGWIAAIGAVVLAALAWVGVESSTADGSADLGPSVVIPTPTKSAPRQEPSESLTIRSSHAPSPAESTSTSPPGSGSPDQRQSADGQAKGADRVVPTPPRSAGDDDDDDHDDSDDDDDEHDGDEHDDDADDDD